MTNGKQLSRSQRHKLKRAQQKRATVGGKPVVAIGGILLLLLLGWLFVGRSNQSVESISFPHMHGLAFSADGTQIIVPAHDGFRIFVNGGWQIPDDVPARDYMGYSAVDEGFYSSGHPEAGTGEINPLGLVKSDDLGGFLAKLGFEGESDFHLMAVGFYNHAIYVINPSPNSELRTGLYYSLNDGQSWVQSLASGIGDQPYALAVHPTEANTIAMATAGGAFLSNDYGNSFSLISPPTLVAAVTFSPFGDSLLFGSAGINQFDLDSQETASIEAPLLDSGDVIVYIAMSSVDADHIAIATQNLDIFYTKDGGRSWDQIAENGAAQ